jgi:hypothetical protein
VSIVTMVLFLAARFATSGGVQALGQKRKRRNVSKLGNVLRHRRAGNGELCDSIGIRLLLWVLQRRKPARNDTISWSLESLEPTCLLDGSSQHRSGRFRKGQAEADAFSDHNIWLMALRTDAEFDSFRSDPRWADLIRRIGLPQ